MGDRVARAGFTLVEALVSLAVLALVCAATLGTLQGLLRLRGEIARGREHGGTAERLVQMLACELRQMPAQDQGAVALAGRVEDTGETRWELTTSAALSSRERYPAGLARVGYRWDPRDGRLERREAPLRTSTEGDVPWRVLAEAVERFSLEVFDGRRWQSRWPAASGAAPWRVRIRVAFKDRGGSEATTHVVTIPTSRGAALP